jgi:nucleoside diphosphate kinase
MFMMQNFLGRTNATDASGNTVLGDFGVHIQQEVSDCLYSGSSLMELMVIKLHGSYGKCMIFFLRTTIA